VQVEEQCTHSRCFDHLLANSLAKTEISNVLSWVSSYSMGDTSSTGVVGNLSHLENSSHFHIVIM